MLADDVIEQAAGVLDLCRRRGATVATAESCTGGLIAATLTAVAGCSDVVDRGFVTYSNAAKADLLGVPTDLIAAHGAVSAPVARAMAEGARERAGTNLAVAVTGIAGPGGGTHEKPVGLVHLALARSGSETIQTWQIFSGDRAAVRQATVVTALNLIQLGAEA